MGKLIHEPKYINDPKWCLIKTNLDQIISIAKTRYIKIQNSVDIDEEEFQKWLAKDYFDVKLSYWRHMRDGRKPFSKPFIRKVEEREGLPFGFLENKEQKEAEVRGHFFDCMLFVREYLVNNQIEISPQVEKKLLEFIYSDSIENSKLSEQAIGRFLKALS